MKNLLKLFSFYVLFLLTSSAPAQGLIEWQNTIGAANQDYLLSIQQTTDGGYILGGSSISDISGDKTENSFDYDYWIIKLDGSGNILWQNTIGGNDEDRLNAIEQTTDGGYILGGISKSNVSIDKTENCLGGYDYWVVKINDAGNIQWQNTVGGSGGDWLNSIHQTFDEGYILGGYSNSNISGDKTEDTIGDFDYWIIKLDALGNIQWQNTVGGNGEDALYSIEPTFDSGYIAGGTSRSDSTGDKIENRIGGVDDYWVIKLDSFGNILWQNTIGGDGSDRLASIKQTNDGTYIIAGTSNSNSSGDKIENRIGVTDYWVVKLNASGDTIQWQNTIGGDGTEGLQSVEQTNDGGYILGGWSYSNISGDKTENNRDPLFLQAQDYWVVHIDSTGSILWQKTIGGNLTDWLSSIQQTTDGGYILGGYSSSDISGDKTEPHSIFDYWVVKLYPDTVTSINKMPINSKQVALYPNPITETATLDYSSISEKVNSISLINLLGERVASYQTSSAKRLQIQTSPLPSGMYVITLSIENGNIQKKVIVK